MTDSALDLDRYLARIGYGGRLDATLATLEGLHHAHVARVPFENLDVQMGLPVRLDLESLQAKIVDRERGGYCFEQNALFAAVLRHLGFAVTTLSARVRSRGATGLTPRTHMLLRVDLSEGPFIADVGFGGDGPTAPLRFVDGEEQSQLIDTYRLTREGAMHQLEVKREGAFLGLYAFTLEEQFPIDYELANYFTSTHPSSRFVQTLVAARPGTGCRYSLHNRDFGTRRGDTVERRTLATDEELFAVLEQTFGLRVPRTSRFRAIHGESGQR
jgi:N-hydroxyarylamine O-acetyltransferase